MDRARNRTIEGYTEKHHIVPSALGGIDDESNLVKLTAREHLIVHMLLPRFVENKKPMWQAVWIMMNTRGRKLTGRLYEQARIEISAALTGRTDSPETRANKSAAKKGKKRKKFSPEHIANMRAAHTGKKGPRKGKTLSSKTRAKMSAAHTGKPKSEAHKQKMSAAKKGRKKITNGTNYSWLYKNMQMPAGWYFVKP